MTHPDTHPDDEALLAELGRLLRTLDGPPPEVVQAGRALFTWRTVDAELAELVYDSLLDDGAFVGVRAAGHPRILSFEAGPVTLEVEVDETPGARRLLGQLAPPGEAELELQTAGEPVRGRADEIGRFVLALPADPGHVSLRCVLADGTAVRSAWMVL